MKKNKLKNIVSYILLPSHFLVILTAIIFYLMKGFKTSELTTMLAIIVPLFASYTTLISAYLTGPNQSSVEEDTPLNPARVFFSIALPIFFTLFLIAIISLKAFNIGFETFEDFKTLLGISEGIFGVYVGIFIRSLYKDN